MQILIRHIHRDRQGREELLEEVLDNPVVSVGRGGEQVIQLLDPVVAHRHLELKAGRGGRFSFRTFGGARVMFGGEPKARGTLEPGSELTLGEQSITVLEPAAGFDGTLEVVSVELEEDLGSATPFRTGLSQTALGRRKPAWVLFLAIILLFLVVPLAGYFWPVLGEGLRSTSLLPSDHAWSSGPLSRAHHTAVASDNCNVCHVRLFERVPDRACLGCHADVRAHAEQDREPSIAKAEQE